MLSQQLNPFYLMESLGWKAIQISSPTWAGLPADKSEDPDYSDYVVMTCTLVTCISLIVIRSCGVLLPIGGWFVAGWVFCLFPFPPTLRGWDNYIFYRSQINIGHPCIVAPLTNTTTTCLLRNHLNLSQRSSSR